MFLAKNPASYTQDTGAGLSGKLGWPEVLIFLATLCRGTILALESRGVSVRAKECVSPAEAVPNHSLVIGQLAFDQI